MAQGNISECTPNTVLNNCSSHYKVLVVKTKMQLKDDQFCRAFFHVPKVLNWNIEMQCLDEEKCMVIDQTKPDPPQSQPRYVVCLVELKRGNVVKYRAMYENCAIGQKKHAEEFFDEDARNGNLKTKLDHIQMENSDLSSSFAGMNLTGLKLYMYITLQPCHKSADLTPDKSCTMVLIDLYEQRLKPLHIEFIVKPTFIYKAYWSPTTEEKLKKKEEELKKLNEEINRLEKLKHKGEEAKLEHNKEKKAKLKEKIYKAKKTNMEIRNAKDGLKMLRKEDIQIQAMSKEDWDNLKDQLCHVSASGGSYEGSERKKLDVFIKDFIEEIEKSVSPSTSDSASSASGSDLQTENSGRNTSRVKKQEYGNLVSHLKIDNGGKLIWNGNEDDLKTFLNLFCKNEYSNEIRQAEIKDKKVKARFDSTIPDELVFRWFNTKTLQCQGNKGKENKDKLSKLATAV